MRIALSNFARRAGMVLASAAFVFAAVVVFSSGAATASVRTQKKAAASAPVQAKAAPAARLAAAKKPVGIASAAKGMGTGITVHGHWVIVVKNPDGKVTARREFENSLSGGITFPNGSGGTFQAPGGGAFLSAVMSGQPVNTVGTWAIFLAGPGGLAGAGGAPCTAQLPGSVFSAPVTLNACALFQLSLNNYFSAGAGSPQCGPLSSCNLTVSADGATPNFTGFQLSGEAVAAQSGTVSSVQTVAFPCAVTPQGSSFSQELAGCPFSSSGLVGFTGRALDGLNGDPPALTVSAGQTIAVTVNISFQ